MNSASFEAGHEAASWLLLASDRSDSGGASPVAANRPAKVLLAARSAIRRAGLEKMLAESDDFKAVGVCSSLALLEQRVRQLAPELVLVDWDVHSDAGELTAALHQVAPHVSTVVLADNPASALTAAMLAVGVRGIIERDSSYHELTFALQGAAEGLTVLGTEAAKTISERLPQRNGSTLALAEELTDRELEVLELLAEGIGNREIGARLGISEHTVKFHISSILGKLSASNRTEAVAHGIKRGLIIV